MPTQPHPSRLRATIVTIAVAATAFAGLVPAATATAASAGSKPAALRPNTHQLITRAVARGEISEAQGALYLSYAFTAPERVPAAYASATPWDGTLPLLELKDTLAGLRAAPAVSAARSLLRGPSFTCPNYSATKPDTKATPHFYLQYKNSTLQGLTINQYASALETTWDTGDHRLRVGEAAEGSRCATPRAGATPCGSSRWAAVSTVTSPARTTPATTPTPRGTTRMPSRRAWC